MGPRSKNISGDRGDIFVADLEPVKGREQQGRRHVIIVTTAAFNKTFGTPLVCPITTGGNFAREAGFTVSLAASGTKTQGVVLCNQARTVDLKERGATFVEKAPQEIIDEVLSRLSTLLE